MQGNYTKCLLQIDRDNGVITVMSHGVRILRVTHLPDPIPANTSIDIVALPALTSYTPLNLLDVKDDSVEGHSSGGKSSG